MNSKIILSTFLATTLIFPTSLSNIKAANSVATPATYQFFYANNTDNFITGHTIVKNGITFVDIRVLGLQNGLVFAWSDRGKRASLNGFMKKMAVRLGSKTAMLDGKSVTLSAAPFQVPEKKTDYIAVYVPLRFAVQVLGGDQVKMDSQNHIIQAQHIHSFNVITDVYKGSTYTLVKTGGELFVNQGKNVPVKLASLGENFDWTQLTFETTPGGLLLITIDDAYGEPHLFSQQYKLLLKKRVLLRQTHIDFGRVESTHQASMFQDQILLSDGKTLRVIDDGTGNVVDQLNLAQISGNAEEQYIVEGLYDDVILMRSISKGQLLLTNRSTGQSVVLYKELLSTELQQQIDRDGSLEIMGLGDSLTFTKRVNTTFHFTLKAGSNQEKKFTYTLNK